MYFNLYEILTIYNLHVILIIHFLTFLGRQHLSLTLIISLCNVSKSTSTKKRNGVLFNTSIQKKLITHKVYRKEINNR